MQSRDKKKGIDLTGIIGMLAGENFSKFNEETEYGFKVRVDKLLKLKPLIEYQSSELKKKVLRHVEKFKKIEIINRGRLFRWEEFDEILKIAEKLEKEGFKLTLDVPLMRLGSPIYGGYIYAYDMNQRDRLFTLARKLKREIRVLQGKPLERDDVENLFFDCLAAGLHYDYHAIWLWLRFEKLQQKYELVAPPSLTKYVCDAELVLMKDLVKKLEELDKNDYRYGFKD